MVVIKQWKKIIESSHSSKIKIILHRKDSQYEMTLVVLTTEKKFITENAKV